MKKLVLSLAVLGLLFTSCNDDSSLETEQQNLQQPEVDMSDFALHVEDDSEEFARSNNGKICYSMQVLARQLEENPSLYNKMFTVEKNSRAFLAGKKPDGVGGGGNGGGDTGGGTDPVNDGLGIINIPVYIHVVYSNNQENISDAQIQSQINVLNQDFSASNNDISLTPSEFASVIADTEINFTHAGTFRYASNTTSWGTNDAVKYAYPPVTPETHLNIWVCNIGGGILGYAQFPGGALATDGVVVGPQYFGNTGYVAAPFDEGRTLTHEVGHYLNLRHIWGDGRCNRDDYVADTPVSDAPNYGCPGYPTVNCRSTDMTMNYMDYVNDACMYMFSQGQKERMRAIFAANGPRSTMAN